jgi:hypothetical protein
MNISGIQFAGGPMPLPDGSKGSKAQPNSTSARKDSVELSTDSDKKDSTTAGIAAVAEAREPIREERVQEVRRKLDEGFYDQSEVIDQTAKKLMDKKLI